MTCSVTVSSEDGKDHRQQHHRTILSGFESAPSFLLEPEYIQGIKIRLLGIGTPWSGDIPIELPKGRHSVLVRVPLKDKGQCLTVWCRLVTEQVLGGSQGGVEAKRCLLIFSPMYVARSTLPSPVKLKVGCRSGH